MGTELKSKSHRNRKAADYQPARDEPVGAEPRAPRIAKMLDIPSSALIGLPQMELSGNREAVVEGCQGILEYDENVVRLATGKMSIKFTGRNLQIRVLTHDSAIVEGFIVSIEFTA